MAAFSDADGKPEMCIRDSGYTITGTLTLSDKMYMSPRITAPTYGTTTCT